MQLYAAVVPPRQARADLGGLVRSVRLPSPGGPPGRHRGAAGRLGSLVRRRPAAEDEAPPSTAGMLTAVDPPDLRVHLASFGNLNQGDARRLVTILAEAAAQWPVPRLRLAGGVALDWPGDVGVWARLDGDVEALGEIARSIPLVAQKLRLYIDRRNFRPLVRLGSITDDTTVPYLEQLLADLDSYESPWWDQETLPLLQLRAGSDDGQLAAFETIRLGPPPR